MFPITRFDVEKTWVSGRPGLARVQRRSFHAPLAQVLLWQTGTKMGLENLAGFGSSSGLRILLEGAGPGIEKGQSEKGPRP